MKIILGLVFIGIFASGIFYSYLQNSQLPLATTVIYPKTKQLPQFALTDHRGKAFANEQLQGKWSILFFGYTYCPDICPTTMVALAQVANKLSPEILKQVQFVFISVDPERDTTDRLAEYIPFYNSDFIAVTAEELKLQPFAMSLGAMYMKVPFDDSYTMSHSGTLFIINPAGQRYGIFSRSASGIIDVAAIAHDITLLVP